MPDEITLVMLFEKLLRVEIMLSEVLTNQKACSSFQLEGDDIIKAEEVSPFVNPDTGLNDVNYYRSEHPKDKKEK
jgi:hypothetical protein